MLRQRVGRCTDSGRRPVVPRCRAAKVLNCARQRLLGRGHFAFFLPRFLGCLDGSSFRLLASPSLRVRCAPCSVRQLPLHVDAELAEKHLREAMKRPANTPELLQIRDNLQKTPVLRYG